jgi:RNA polymerase sigma-70 factor (ECF subfamily)
MNDSELTALLENGSVPQSKIAFKKIYEKYWLRLLKIAYNFVENEKATEDIVQDIFVSIWKNRKKTNIEKLENYLFRAAKLKCFQHLRDNKIRRSHIHRIESLKFTNNIEEYLNFKESKQQIDKCIEKLPNKCRKVFKLSRFNNMSNAQVAENLKISVKTVEGHITSGLKRLRNCYDSIDEQVDL